jgi:hypothetical protein
VARTCVENLWIDPPITIECDDRQMTPPDVALLDKNTDDVSSLD